MINQNQNNSMAPGANGTAQTKLNKQLNFNVMKVFRLLAFFALVGSVGYAIASNQQDICEDKSVESYRQIVLTTPPTLPPEDDPNMEPIGNFDDDFTCTTNKNATCHYVYDPTHDDQVDGWVKCEGTYVDRR